MSSVLDTLSLEELLKRKKDLIYQIKKVNDKINIKNNSISLFNNLLNNSLNEEEDYDSVSNKSKNSSEKILINLSNKDKIKYPNNGIIKINIKKKK